MGQSDVSQAATAVAAGRDQPNKSKESCCVPDWRTASRLLTFRHGWVSGSPNLAHRHAFGPAQPAWSTGRLPSRSVPSRVTGANWQNAQRRRRAGSRVAPAMVSLLLDWGSYTTCRHRLVLFGFELQAGAKRWQNKGPRRQAVVDQLVDDSLVAGLDSRRAPLSLCVFFSLVPLTDTPCGDIVTGPAWRCLPQHPRACSQRDQERTNNERRWLLVVLGQSVSTPQRASSYYTSAAPLLVLCACRGTKANAPDTRKTCARPNGGAVCLVVIGANQQHRGRTAGLVFGWFGLFWPHPL